MLYKYGAICVLCERQGEMSWWCVGKKEAMQLLDHSADFWSVVIEQAKCILGMHPLLEQPTPRSQKLMGCDVSVYGSISMHFSYS